MLLKVDFRFLYNALMTKYALLFYVSHYFMNVLHNFISINHIINFYF